jgi:hypothetical protein
MLTKEIEDLLAGKDLAKETLAKWEERRKRRKASDEARPPEGEDAQAEPGEQEEAAEN